MKEDENLRGKTFDQQLLIAGDDIVNRDISPNRRIAGEIVFESMGAGVRVSARDEQHRVLWGYVGTKDTVKEIHCLVGVYDTLQKVLAEELEKRGLFSSGQEDPLIEAERAISRLQNTLDWLKKSLEVKNVREATLERAKSIAQIASDANRQIVVEAGSLKGMKPRTE